MDVLNCELLWIGGSCYRKLTPINRFSPSGSVDVADKCDEHIYDVGASGVTSYDDEPTCLVAKPKTMPVLNDDSSAGGPKGFFRLTHYVPQKFIPRLCGKKHVVRIQMEHDTNTSIKVPSPDSCEDVIITGQREQDVESAHLRISATVSGMRQHEHYTHFVCFPLNNQKLGGTLEEFKEIVMKSCTGRGLDASLFVNKQKLHLTIGMLVLLDAKECSMAQKVLEGCKDLVTTILKDEPLMVRVHGLEIMNDDESEVDVLYAKVSSSYIKEGPSRSPGKCRLQLLADAVAQRFLDSGFMLRQQDRGRGPEHVKLHMTIMNTRLREQRFATENTALPPARKPRNSFDASAIMKRNRDFSFGRVHVPSINVVHPHNCDDDGFYKKIATLCLPKQQH
ncbi:activating signal cointegrator 1 complex subunit 1 isoform X1 [Dermacentor silvarum]|uniref:activating signal cointegrator 1 complex subunit 1 isoform X1 n=2 Tax=Dermacentor silvarum TaxID=543639 RepID=UPI00189A7934|nr:activating signal cointegrator 1 complex subunit 1 isoform X1 [Dermacentor silvarum]